MPECILVAWRRDSVHSRFGIAGRRKGASAGQSPGQDQPKCKIERGDWWTSKGDCYIHIIGSSESLMLEKRKVGIQLRMVRIKLRSSLCAATVAAVCVG